MVKIVPYLNLPNCLKAIELYKKVFDVKVLNHQPFTKENSQGRFSADYDYENSTMYALVEILGQQIHMSDSSTNLSPLGMVDLYVELDSEEQINKIYNNAKEIGSKIHVELAKQFWGAYYTNFKDPVGITWQLSAAPNQSSEKTNETSKKTEKKPKKKPTAKKTVLKKNSKSIG